MKNDFEFDKLTKLTTNYVSFKEILGQFNIPPSSKEFLIRDTKSLVKNKIVQESKTCLVRVQRPLSVIEFWEKIKQEAISKRGLSHLSYSEIFFYEPRMVKKVANFRKIKFGTFCSNRKPDPDHLYPVICKDLLSGPKKTLKLYCDLIFINAGAYFLMTEGQPKVISSKEDDEQAFINEKHKSQKLAARHNSFFSYHN